MATPYVFSKKPEVSSTQDLARRDFGGKPVVWMAARQTHGRGRSGNEWLTAPHAVAMSVAFEPAWPPSTWTRIPLIAGIAASDAIAAEAGVAADLKWPNDLFVEERKVGGILSEAFGDLVVVGIGVNLSWPSPPAGVGAIWDERPPSGARGAIAHAIATRLLTAMAASPLEWGRDEYRRRCRTIGHDIRWVPDGMGRAIDIDDDGALVVQAGAGTIRLSSGSVSEVRST